MLNSEVMTSRNEPFPDSTTERVRHAHANKLFELVRSFKAVKVDIRQEVFPLKTGREVVLNDARTCLQVLARLCRWRQRFVKARSRLEIERWWKVEAELITPVTSQKYVIFTSSAVASKIHTHTCTTTQTRGKIISWGEKHKNYYQRLLTTNGRIIGTNINLSLKWTEHTQVASSCFVNLDSPSAWRHQLHHTARTVTSLRRHEEDVRGFPLNWNLEVKLEHFKKGYQYFRT